MTGELQIAPHVVVSELRRMRELRISCPVLLGYLEALLAYQGDAADRELIALQHALAELLQPPAPTPVRSDLP